MPSPGLGSTAWAAELTSNWLAMLRWLFWLAVKSSKVVLQLDALLESMPCNACCTDSWCAKDMPSSGVDGLPCDASLLARSPAALFVRSDTSYRKINSVKASASSLPVQ